MLVPRFFRQILECKRCVASTPELPFSKLVTQERIAALLGEQNVLYRERVFSPSVTLWLFLWQVLSADHSCRDVLARLLAFHTAQGLPPCSTQTGSYCQARQRLPEALLSRLTRETGQELHEQALDAWHLHGRPVKIVDGAVVSMPDTAANAKEFGKATNQHGWVGFPLARFVVLICLATGAVLDLASGPYRGKRTGERSLFRHLWDLLTQGDILLGDRIFGTYMDIAELVRRGVDVIFRLHAHRKSDFRRGKRLGHDDHLVTWRKPTRCPDGMSPAEFAALPAELTLREVRVTVNVPGFRVRRLIVVTTLLDPQQFSQADIANLFRHRWHAELDLRSIKTVMQMDVLRCKTPDMVRKEMWAHLLAYNLLRSVMCAAAEEAGMPVRQVSFKGTLQVLNAFYHAIISSDADQLEELCTTLLHAVAQHRVGDRPNRYEPRKRKRDAKPYPRLKKSRHEERNKCLSNRLQ